MGRIVNNGCIMQYELGEGPGEGTIQGKKTRTDILIPGLWFPYSHISKLKLSTPVLAFL